VKKVLVISPYFPPTNAADMQRIRTSLPYFKDHDWDATIITVDEKYSEQVRDNLLLQGVPEGVVIHKVKAFSRKWTSKLGLGSIALRSLWFYRKKVNAILKKEKFDLIYFSTTQFPVCILGSYWKRRFNIPYVIDMQDPWHSDYYKDKPKEQRPAKYWFSYRLNKYLEPIALKNVDGLISVSQHYIDTLKTRYPVIKNVPEATITFGAFEPDLKIARDNQAMFSPILNGPFVNIVYVGRGGADMHKSVAMVFEALKKGLANEPEQFNKLKFWFIGTSYAPAGLGIPTIFPLAKQYGVEGRIMEITDRISYYQSLTTLQYADALFIPGSDDPQYTASKIYPYMLMEKPLLAIFNKNSSAVEVLNNCAQNVTVLTIGEKIDKIYQLLKDWANGTFEAAKPTAAFDDYSAKRLTGKQIELFNQAIKYFETTHTNA
jgi:hypothetical protein